MKLKHVFTLHSEDVATFDDQEQQQYLKRLRELMVDKNNIDVCYLKVFLIGPPFVGKTTTLNRLLKNFENILTASKEDQIRIQSTLLANCTQVLVVADKDDAQIKWLYSEDISEETKLLFRYLYGCNSSIKSDSMSISIQKSSNHSLVLRDVTKSFTTDVSGSLTLTQSASHNQYPQINDVILRLEKLIESGNYSQIIRLSSKCLFNINDVGGQPGFLEMLPFLSFGPAMYLVFFDLSKELDQPYKIPFNREDSKLRIMPFDSVNSVEATISQILSSVASVHCIYQHSFSSEVKKLTQINEKVSRVRPVATLIGTHKDKVDAQTIKQMDPTLEKITDKFCDIISKPDKERYFFPVDNYSGTDQSDIAPIREFMCNTLKIHFKDTALPIQPKCLLFNVVLRREYCIISMEDCLKIGKALKMNKEDVEFCLWYLHHLVGTLMYFPKLSDEWFKNHIICSPQVIFDSISQLILASLRTLHSDGPLRECDRQDWIKKGQFSADCIEKYCSCDEVATKIQNCELIPTDKLIRLLEYVNILSPIGHSTTDMPQTTYLMPAVLECASPDELLRTSPVDANNPEPLFITFKYKYVPTGAFCGLITKLVSLGPNKILGLEWQLKQTSVKRNRIAFLVDNVHTVTLLCHESSYEIQVSKNDPKTSLHDICTYVLSVILYTLKQLFKHLDLFIAFKCFCPKHKEIQNIHHL